MSAFDVSPFVGVVRLGSLRVDGTETSDAFTIPLADVLARLTDGVVEVGSIEVASPVLDYGERRIWGLTGRILRMFVDAWNADPSELRPVIESRLVS